MRAVAAKGSESIFDTGGSKPCVVYSSTEQRRKGVARIVRTGRKANRFFGRRTGGCAEPRQFRKEISGNEPTGERDGRNDNVVFRYGQREEGNFIPSNWLERGVGNPNLPGAGGCGKRILCPRTQ